MRKPWIVGGIIFFIGCGLQVLPLYFLGVGTPSPNFLLLAVLALGSRGEINLAQTLGFLWGLSLDVFGTTPFGAQALVFVTAGFLSGILSRQLNADKLLTRETIGLAGFAFFLGGVRLIETIFGDLGLAHGTSGGKLLLEILFNGVAIPVVFSGVNGLCDLWKRFVGSQY